MPSGPTHEHGPVDVLTAASHAPVAEPLHGKTVSSPPTTLLPGQNSWRVTCALVAPLGKETFVQEKRPPEALPPCGSSHIDTRRGTADVGATPPAVVTVMTYGCLVAPTVRMLGPESDIAFGVP
jgi:hypothetical protein